MNKSLDLVQPGLGRVIPQDFDHLDKYRASAVLPRTVGEVNTSLSLPAYRDYLNQGTEGACVGYSSTWMTGIINRRLYDPRWLWQQARLNDEWPDNDDLTDESQGTSVRAGLEILRTQGHSRWYPKKGSTSAAKVDAGIQTYRWARSVDEIRTSISQGMPVVLGVDWFSNYDTPRKLGRYFWIGDWPEYTRGYQRGGHAICCYGAHDKSQAFRLVNSWGRAYPNVFLPYEELEFLLGRYGEAGIATDR